MEKVKSNTALLASTVPWEVPTFRDLERLALQRGPEPWLIHHDSGAGGETLSRRGPTTAAWAEHMPDYCSEKRQEHFTRVS